MQSIASKQKKEQQEHFFLRHIDMCVTRKNVFVVLLLYNVVLF